MVEADGADDYLAIDFLDLTTPRPYKCMNIVYSHEGFQVCHPTSKQAETSSLLICSLGASFNKSEAKRVLLFISCLSLFVGEPWANLCLRM
jgi:hypothetical protein